MFLINIDKIKKITNLKINHNKLNYKQKNNINNLLNNRMNNKLINMMKRMLNNNLAKV